MAEQTRAMINVFRKLNLILNETECQCPEGLVRHYLLVTGDTLEVVI